MTMIKVTITTMTTRVTTMITTTTNASNFHSFQLRWLNFFLGVPGKVPE